MFLKPRETTIKIKQSSIANKSIMELKCNNFKNQSKRRKKAKRIYGQLGNK